jgi:hypothetical protein
MPSASAATISIQETLQLLDGPFASFAEGVAENRYALWLGSGISLGRVEGLKKVIPRVIEFLRSRISGDPCRFRTALKAALQLAQLSPHEAGRVDFGKPFSDWPDAEAITDRLIGKYSSLLDVEVDGEAGDFLLWNAVDVIATFADPGIPPDVSHICIAILILEGVASDIASANWDGLVESAVNLLAPEHPTLVVYVRPEDLRQPDLKGRLFKFHGCAMKASADEIVYREYIVGRQSQIHSWAARPENKAMVDRLTDIATTKPTLMIGLSAQDANIQALFSRAEATMKWPWPGDRPSYLFSNDALGIDHKTLLQNVYRDAYTPSTRDDIKNGALVRAYAEPLLVALVLHVICSKLKRLIELAPGTLGPAEQQKLHQGVLALRDMMAGSAATADRMTFIKSFVEQNGRALSMFRDGQVAKTPHSYNPITSTPIQQIAGDVGLSATGLTEVAVAAGVLGLGVKAGDWTLTVDDPGAGVIHIESDVSSATVFFVVNSYVALRLEQQGHLTDPDRTILIHSKDQTAPLRRSPSRARGRSGRAGMREVSISALLEEITNVDDLMQRFREEVAV